MAEKPVYVTTATTIAAEVEAFIEKFKLEENDDRLMTYVRRYARRCVAVAPPAPPEEE
jgi:hypothetical protein